MLDENIQGKVYDISIEIGLSVIRTQDTDAFKKTDDVVARFAVEHGYVVVTGNGKDFRTIYYQIEDHPGLIIVSPKR